MGIDTKPNLSNDKFEQFSGETLSLSGCTDIYGVFQIENGASFCMTENAAAGRVIISDASGKGTWQDLFIAGGENITKEIEQTSHGFDVQDVVGWSGSTYNLAIADGTYDGEVLGLVTKCYNADCFDLTQAGYVTGLTGLVANCTYFLSDTTAGLLTTDEPTTDGHVSKAVLVANSATSGWVLPYAGYIVTTGDSGGGVWGTIVGTLSDQTDLQDALDAKLDVTGLTYTLNSPATCTVGGITPGYVLTGKSLMCILQDAIAPYIVPTFSAFNMSGTFPIEVGTAMSGFKTFTWTTTTSANVATNSIGVCEVGGSVLSTGLPNNGTASIDIGTKTNTTPTTWTWQISGCSTQNDCFTRNVSKCSIYPYFWGVETCGTRPAVTNGLVTGGTKVVAAVGTSVTVDFNNVGQWTWIAIQCDYASRTKWISGAAPNCGDIAVSPTDKYPDECVISISSGQGCWSGVEYKVYMSGSASTDALPICFRTY
jgi:hypothetical protein